MMALDARSTLLQLSLFSCCWGLVLVVQILSPAFMRPVLPLLLLPCLHAWDKIIPSCPFPLWLLFLSGILADHLAALPLGAVTLTALCLKGGLMWQARKQSHELGFWMHWLEFCLLGSVAMALLYGVICFYYGTLMPVGAVFLQALLTLLSYPIIYRLYYGIVCAIIPHR